MAIRRDNSSKARIPSMLEFPSTPVQVIKEQRTMIPMSMIKLDSRNPRKNDHAVPKLAKLLSLHGQRSPVVVWRKNMTIYKGNTTYKAALSLGWKDIWVSLQDFENEAAARMYRDSDNKSSEWSEWDEDLVRDEFDWFEQAGIARQRLIERSGFTEEEIRGILLEPDLDRIGKIEAEQSDLQGAIKIKCNAENKDEIKEILKEWAKDCGFEGVTIE